MRQAVSLQSQSSLAKTYKGLAASEHASHTAAFSLTMPSPVLPPSSSRLSQLTLQQLWELLAPVTVHPQSPRGSFTNWGLTYTCRPLCVFEPENEAQCEVVLELARREGKKVRVAGVGHSPSDLACTSEYMLRTGRLDKVVEVSAIVI